MDRPLIIKLRILFIPYVVFCIALILGYTFLNWLLFMNFQIFHLKENIRNYWIPCALPWIPLIFWYRPRIKLLKLRSEGRRDPASAIMMLAGLAISASLVVTETYFSTASAQVTSLNKVSAINTVSSTRYYTIRNYAADKHYNRCTYTLSDKSNRVQYVIVSLYIVCPLYDPSNFPYEDTSRFFGLSVSDPDNVHDGAWRQVNDTLGAPPAWAGFKYSRQISATLTRTEIQGQADAFIRDFWNDFAQSPDTGFTYFDAIPYDDDYIAFRKSARRSPRYKEDSSFKLLIPRTSSFTARNGSLFPWMLGSFGIGSAVLFLIFLLVPLDKKKVARWQAGR